MISPAPSSAPAEALAAEAPAAATPPPPRPPAWQPPAQRNTDILGIGWLHGTLHAAVFRRQKLIESWSAPAPVHTLVEFEPALDEALTALKFAGTEVSLLLENDPFIHQAEHAPAISEAAARHYLKGRVARYEKEHEAVLWVSQKTVSMKQDSSYILHLLPGSFYDALNRMLLVRRLALARILPLIAPLQREVDRFPCAKGRPVLVAVEAGGATILIVAQVGGQLLFSRTILASWSADPERIGVEINRSLFYVNQQFGMAVERIWLLGQDNHSTALVNAKCGSGKQIMVLPTKPVEWLQSVAKLSAGHPGNLVAGYLKRKRRNFHLRVVLLTACWLGFGLQALDFRDRTQSWTEEQHRLADLSAHETALMAERDHLTVRNRAVVRQREFIQQADEDRLPPAPGKFLAYVAGLLPPTVRLTDFNVKWNGAEGGWSFRFDGTVEADEETAHEIIDTVQRQLAKSPLRVRFNSAARAVVSMPGAGASAAPDVQHFSVEGVMLEN